MMCPAPPGSLGSAGPAGPIQAQILQTGSTGSAAPIATNASSFRDVTIRNAAFATGVQHVIASAPEAMATLGVTPDHVRQMIEARFGGLLATDPTVTIGTTAHAS